MAEEKEKPVTREDVLKKIEENGGTAKGLNLSGKIFEKGVDLSKLDLEGIIFQDAVLDSADFQGSRLWGAHLEGADLMGAHFEGADLHTAYLERVDLKFANLEGANLTYAHLEGADLWRAHVKGANLMYAHLKGAVLAAVELSRDTKLGGVDWGNYFLGEERRGWFSPAAYTYRRLKIWYTEHGIYDVAGEFFYREMEVKRKALKWWPNPLSKIRQTLYWLLCGYGERPWQVFASAAVVIFGLAGIYFFLGAFASGTFAGCLYYSVVSFTALGYGSWVYPEPESWAKGLGAAEAAFGISMIALFLVTFIRKMTR